MTYFDHMMGLKDGIADKYDGALITHVSHGPEDRLNQGPADLWHPLEIRVPYPPWPGAREFLRVDANGEEWEARIDRARAVMERLARGGRPWVGPVSLLFALRTDQEAGFGIEPSSCCACRAEPGRDDRHQSWCPESGGWYCQACQAFSPPGAACATCRRERKAAEIWSPYAECPACGGGLADDDQGERARCAECGWEEGE